LELQHARGVRAAVLRLAPWAGLFALYFGLRAAFGFGAYGSGMYVDPFAEPGLFAREAAARLPVLAGDLMLSLRSNFWTSGLPWAPQLAAAGVIPEVWVHDLVPLRAMQERIGLVGLALLAVLLPWT